MSDISNVPQESPQVTEPPSSPEVTEPVASPEATPQPEEQGYVFNGSLEDASAEIRRLRDENAKRRLDTKSYEEYLGNFEEPERNAWLELGKLWKSDPDQAREVFKELAAIEAAQEQQQQTQVFDAQQPFDPNTISSVVRQAMQEERQAQAHAAELQKIDLELSNLGYKQGTPEAETVMQLALTRTKGDIGKANELFKGIIQAQVDARLAALSQGTPTPPVAEGPQGSPVANPSPPKTFKEARAAARAFLNEAAQAQP